MVYLNDMRMEGRPIRILLAIWGNYKNWRTATYKYRGEEFTSSTTLPLLFKAIEPDYTYVIVADTLMDEYMDEVNSNYQQGIEKVREKTKIYIEEKMGEYTNDLEEKNLDILVLPGVGTFSKLKFIGDPNNFYALVYYKLGKSILKIMNYHKLIFGNSKEENKPFIEFYLDITHGLNYMTMMTYRAVKDILQIVAYFCKVQLVVLNSDPYPLLKSGGEGFLLNINEIERINVIPVFNFYRYHHLKLLKPSEFCDNEERENIGRTINQNKTMEKVRKDMNEIYAFCGAFMHGLPIFIYYFYPEINDSDIQNLIDVFYSYISISNTIVMQKVDFAEDFISLLQAFILSNLLSSKVEKKSELTLEDIEEIKEVFGSSRVISQRLERELFKLRKLNYKADFDFVDYGNIAMENNEYKGDQEFNERNFFAHCGFGYNVIQVKKEGSLIQLKPKSALFESIKSTIVNSIPSGG